MKNLLYSYQSVFRKKHSTDFCFYYLNDKILKGFDNGLVTGMILIDLQKALDTVDHDILLQKLYAIGFSKHTVNWFRSYLSNRSFLVNLGINFFKPASVSCGVPQGSISGPLLFLMSMTCHKLSNVIFFSMPMMHVLFVNIMILIKLKIS